MKAVKIIEPGKMIVEEVPIPEPADDEVLIKVMCCGICGSDVHIFRGQYIDSYPVTPGHEFSGIVEKVGGKVAKFKTGDRVAVEPNIACDNCYNCLHNRQNFCLNWQAVGVTRPGGMAEYTVAPEKNTFDISGISYEQGSFVEPLSCVLHGLMKTQITVADRILILGAGPIGLLLLQTTKILGASSVTVVEKNQSRADFAKEIGADIIFNDFKNLKPDFYDVAIDATGVVKVMSQTLNFVRYGGTVLFFGVANPGEKMEVVAFDMFKKGLKILTSYTSLKNSYQAIELLKTEKVRVQELISHKLPLEEFQKGIEIIEEGEDFVKKIVVLPTV